MLNIQKLVTKYRYEVFLVSEFTELTYSQFCTKVSLVHSEFEKLNIKENDRVAIIGSNSEEYVIVLLALILYGAIAVPINHHAPIEGTLNILKYMNCSHVFYDDNLNELKLCNNEIPFFFINQFNKIDINDSEQLIIHSLDLDRVSTILLTSGSSGNPKGVAHSLRNHIYSALGSNLNIPFGGGDRWLLSLPLFHVGGIAILFRALMSGGAVVLPKSRNMLLMPLKMNKISHLSLVPTQFYRLIKNLEVNKNTFNIKAVLIGGDRISKSILGKGKKLKLPLYLSYGSTEMSSQITTTGCLTELSDKISYGKPLKYRQLIINNEGDILVKGETLFIGYVSNDSINSCKDINGWFKTGDEGMFDDQGNLIILGRKDNMFISGGENIHPEEIELCLEKHQDVLKAIVVHVSDCEFGNISAAFIHSTSKIKPDKDKLEQILKQLLPKYKWPEYYFELPHNNNSMKISRKELIKLANKYIT